VHGDAGRRTRLGQGRNLIPGQEWPALLQSLPSLVVRVGPKVAESTHSATKIGLDDPNEYFRPNPEVQNFWVGDRNATEVGHFGFGCGQETVDPKLFVGDR